MKPYPTHLSDDKQSSTIIETTPGKIIHQNNVQEPLTLAYSL